MLLSRAGAVRCAAGDKNLPQSPGLTCCKETKGYPAERLLAHNGEGVVFDSERWLEEKQVYLLGYWIHLAKYGDLSGRKSLKMFKVGEKWSENREQGTGSRHLHQFWEEGLFLLRPALWFLSLGLCCFDCLGRIVDLCLS